MDDDNRPERRNYDGIYQKIDKLENSFYICLEQLKKDDSDLKTEVRLLTYQVGVIIAGVKVLLGAVFLAVIGAVFKLIFIR